MLLADRGQGAYRGVRHCYVSFAYNATWSREQPYEVRIVGTTWHGNAPNPWLRARRRPSTRVPGLRIACSNRFSDDVRSRVIDDHECFRWPFRRYEIERSDVSGCRAARSPRVRKKNVCSSSEIVRVTSVSKHYRITSTTWIHGARSETDDRARSKYYRTTGGYRYHPQRRCTT